MSNSNLPLLVNIDAAATDLLNGLVIEYAHAAGSGRIEKWAAAAHAIVDLLADQGRTELKIDSKSAA